MACSCHLCSAARLRRSVDDSADSFNATTIDPRFVEQAEATLGDFRPLNRAEVRHIIKDILMTDPKAVMISKGLRKKYGLPLITDLKQRE